MATIKNKNISVLGCGRWGSFHAWYQSNILKNNVLLWGRGDDDCYKNLATTRKNNFLTLPNSVKMTSDLAKALNHAKYIIISISSQNIRDLAQTLESYNAKNKTFILCMKGICKDTGERLSESMKSTVDKSNKICVWVGPGHVQDFTSGQPNVMFIAAEDKDVAASVAAEFASDLIKLYVGNDLIGAEVGAAAKNVMGIAAGMLDGAHFPSLKGALMSRGTYEVSRLICAMGGDKMTAYGLSHLGDFEATLFSQNSHNRMYGEEFISAWNEKRPPKNEVLAEGVMTSKALMVLAEKYNVDMPISTLVYKVLHEKKSPEKEMKNLFLRPYTEEFRYDQ